MIMNQAQDIDLQCLGYVSRFNKHTGDTQILLRSIPYPYRAMLAICSDLNETR